ncbi:MAG: TerB family tellurite resistance protein [Bacteroidetes bacterium]|nr:TerB family tellurite resistance protein [Bacteroidota bacterium]
MFDYLKNLLSPNIEEDISIAQDNDERIKTATCVLFIELARADGDFSEEEKLLIAGFIKNNFVLSSQSAEELIQYSELKRKESLDLYQFTSIINSSFSREEKFDLMINLWQLVYSDNKLDKYEDYIIKKIGGLLNLHHKEIIDAKLLVKEKIKKDNS